MMRDAAGVLGGLALGVVEVGGNGDDGLGDLLAQELGGVVDQLAQHHGRDFLGGVELVPDLEADGAVGAGHDVVRHGLQLGLHLFVPAADEPLGRRDRPLGIEDGLPAGQLADEAVALLGEGDHRGCGPGTFGVRDHGRLTTLDGGDHRIGRAQVDANCLGHDRLSSSRAGSVQGPCRGLRGASRRP
jgi:hypothetical protein